MIKPINNDVYDIMIKYPNSFKLAHGASSAELSAWRLLKKYAVVEEQCPITKEVGNRVVSLFLLNIYIFHLFNESCGKNIMYICRKAGRFLCDFRSIRFR